MCEASNDLRRLLGQMQQQASSERFFIIFESLQHTVSEGLVSGILKEFKHPMHYHSTIVSTILNQGLKTFCILAWIHQEDRILHFIKHNELDDRSPLEDRDVRRVDKTVSDRFWKEVQWEYLPYKFCKADFHRVLRDPVILPIVLEHQLAEGVSGELFTSIIHASQQNFFSQKVSF